MGDRSVREAFKKRCDVPTWNVIRHSRVLFKDDPDPFKLHSVVGLKRRVIKLTKSQDNDDEWRSTHDDVLKRIPDPNMQPHGCTWKFIDKRIVVADGHRPYVYSYNLVFNEALAYGNDPKRTEWTRPTNVADSRQMNIIINDKYLKSLGYTFMPQR